MGRRKGFAWCVAQERTDIMTNDKIYAALVATVVTVTLCVFIYALFTHPLVALFMIGGVVITSFWCVVYRLVVQ